MNGAVPDATTVNVAEAGAVTVTFAGCVVMPGAMLTVSVADALVTVPAPFVTTTLNRAPLSPSAVGSSV